VNKPLPNSFRQGPDVQGRFGQFGGRFVAETLMPLILEVEQAYEAAKRDPAFDAEWRRLLTHYVGRPSPLWFAERLTRISRKDAAPGWVRRSTSSATS
jgi:tryptophan synthase beta chain